MELHMRKNRVDRLFALALLGLMAGCHASPTTAPGKLPPANIGHAQQYSDTADGWQKVMATDGSFSVSMPGAPQKNSVQSKSPFGPITVEIYALNGTTSAYNVMSTVYPVNKLTAAQEEDLFQKSMASLGKKTGATVLSQKKITLYGSSGRELLVNMDKTSQLHMKFVLIKNRMIAYGVEYPQNQPVAPEVERFLNSMKVLLPPQQ